MATDDAVLLLRSLKAAGEKTGAVEAEGALHLRRNSRRTLDGNHGSETAAALAALQGAPSATLSVPKCPSATSTTAATSSAASGGGAAAAVATPVLTSAVSFSSHTIHNHPGNGNGNGNGTTAANNQPIHGGGITLASALPTSGSLPIISSPASSPAISPSRLSVRPPNPLTSLPSPTGSSPSAAAAAAAPGSAAAAVPAFASVAGPPSPPPHGSPGFPRRSIHTHSANDVVQLPHAHGSPLPLIFDPPVSLPLPLPAAASPTGAGGSSGPGVAVGIPSVPSPSSPTVRQIQFAAAATAAVASPSAPSSSLPSIASPGISAGGGGGVSPPAAPAPMPSLLLPSSSIRSPSARSSIAGAPNGLLAAAAGGGNGSGGGGICSPLSKSLPTANGPSAAGPSSPAGSSSGGGARLLRPPLGPGPGTPFSLPQATASAAAPPSPGSPSASSPVVRGGGSAPDAGSGLAAGTLPVALSAAQSAMQAQMQAAAPLPPAQSYQHHPHPPARPSSARSIAGGGGGGGAAADGLSGTHSSRRLSMTGGFESSQRLVMAAAHELSALQQSTLHHQQQQHHHHQHQQQQQSQPQLSAQQQQLLQQVLPPSPSQLAAPRLAGTSARGPSLSVAAVAASGGAAAAAALPRVAPRSSDPGTCNGTAAAAAAAAAAPALVGFGFPSPEPSSAGRPSLTPLQGAAATRASTPPAAASSAASGMGWPHSLATASPHLSFRAARPEPLPQRPEVPPAPQPPVAAPALAAASTSLPEPLQLRQEALPPLPAAAAGAGASPLLPMQDAAGAAALAGGGRLPAVPLVRAGTLAPLGLPDEPPPVAVGAGPVVESTESATPNLDPAALFGPGSGSGSRAAFMELTVRSIAMRPATPGSGVVSGGGGGDGAAGEKFAVQSSVRQRLQTDPLRFHPPAAGGARRHGCLDPLEATPRLVLAGGGGAAAAAAAAGIPAPRHPSVGRIDGHTTRATAADALWAPSQDILPHMIMAGRGSSGGAAAAAAACGSGRPAFQPAASPTGTGSTPLAALIPSTPSLELPTPRLRTDSSTGGTTAGNGAAAYEKSQPQQQQQRAAVGGLQSNYLKALAAAAGLDDGGGGAGRPLLRQRSLSDSGCGSGGGGGSFLAALAAAADSGPVGLPLEGGLAVLGDDMWSRVRSERHHNTRYRSNNPVVAAVAAADEAGDLRGAGDLASNQDDAWALRAGAESAAAGTLPSPAYDPRVGEAAGLAGSTAMGPPGFHSSLFHYHHHQPAPRRNVSSSSSIPAASTIGAIGGVRSCGDACEQLRGSGAAASMTHGSGHVRLDASISSLPLKALRAAQGSGGGGGAGAVADSVPDGAARSKP